MNTSTVARQPTEVVAAVAEAWQRHDAERFAAVFTADASMTLPGVFLQGQDAIREFMAQAFAGPYKGTQVVGTPVGVRQLGPDAAIVNTVGGVLKPGDTKLAPHQEVNATWVLARQDDGWRLASYQNTPRIK